jgi:hypothetical protein
VRSKAAGVAVLVAEHEDRTRRAGFDGLQTCASVWACPVCSGRIAEVRRQEVNTALAWARGCGLVPLHLTLTVRHGQADPLPALLDGLKRAMRRWRQRRDWREIAAAVEGTITATEVTGGGRHGWHPHAHLIALVRAASEAEALALVAPLGDAWRTSLRGLGWDGAEAAFDARGGASVGDYVAKGAWGVAEELTLSNAKTGRSVPGRARSGRTPRQLLGDAADGDAAAAQAWAVYARAFRGRRQLVWSPGLRERAGIKDVSDAEAAEEAFTPGEDAPEAPARVEVARITYPEWRGRPGWRGARDRRGRLLDAAEVDGAAGVARVLADGGTDHSTDEEAAEAVIEETDVELWSKAPTGRLQGMGEARLVPPVPPPGPPPHTRSGCGGGGRVKGGWCGPQPEGRGPGPP